MEPVSAEIADAVAWIAVLTLPVSWFLTLFEFVGMWQFSPLVFSTGITVFSEHRTLPNPTGRLPVGEVLKMASGDILVLPTGKCLFRIQVRKHIFGFHTPFPFKGTIVWTGDHACIRCKIPVFSTAFVAAWLVGWTAGAISTLLSDGEGASAGFLMLALGVAVVVAVVAFFLPLEKHRARTVVDELEAIILARSASDAAA